MPLQVLNLAMQKMLLEQGGLLDNLKGESAARSAIADMLYVMRRSAPCFTMMQVRNPTFIHWHNLPNSCLLCG